MPNALDLMQALPPVRMMAVGYPGTAKTGGIASLLNAGYKVRLVDHESNYAPLLQYTDPKALANLDIMTFQDEFKLDGDYMKPVGKPTAWINAAKALNEWKYTNPDGTETNLGKARDWGPDTVVVLDSLTANTEALIWRMKALLRQGGKLQLQDYGTVVDEQLAFLKKLCKYDALQPQFNRYHLIVLAHLQMIGPKEINEKSDTDNQKIQRDLAELVPTRLYPVAATKNFSTKVHKEFSSMVVAEVRNKNGRLERGLTPELREEIDTKFPAQNFKSFYPIETGYADIFKALGHTPPGL